MFSGLFHYPDRFLLHHLVRKNDGRMYLKNSVVSSSEVCVSEDISETHEAECNAAQVSGINNETDECSVAMATI